MSNIIENEWMRLTPIQIIQCIRCLSECIRLMFEPDLRKFIPKVCIHIMYMYCTVYCVCIYVILQMYWRIR